MAIRDVLWACPFCGAHAALRPARKGEEVCSRCAARFRRAEGADIEARSSDGEVLRRSAASWMVELADPRAPHADQDGPVATAQAAIRLADGYVPVYSRGKFLNRIERLAPVTDGVIELYADRLTFRGKDGTTIDWPLLDLAALGSSSGTLQLRAKGGRAASIRLRDASIRWWEERLRAQLRELYQDANRGEILEFQPRIIAR